MRRPACGGSVDSHFETRRQSFEQTEAQENPVEGRRVIAGKYAVEIRIERSTQRFEIALCPQALRHDAHESASPACIDCTGVCAGRVIGRGDLAAIAKGRLERISCRLARFIRLESAERILELRRERACSFAPLCGLREASCGRARIDGVRRPPYETSPKLERRRIVGVEPCRFLERRARPSPVTRAREKDADAHHRGRCRRTRLGRLAEHHRCGGRLAYHFEPRSDLFAKLHVVGAVERSEPELHGLVEVLFTRGEVSREPDGRPTFAIGITPCMGRIALSA